MFKASAESNAEQQISAEVEEQLQQARDEAAQTCKDGTTTDCAVAWEEVNQVLELLCKVDGILSCPLAIVVPISCEQ